MRVIDNQYFAETGDDWALLRAFLKAELRYQHFEIDPDRSLFGRFVAGDNGDAGRGALCGAYEIVIAPDGEVVDVHQENLPVLHRLDVIFTFWLQGFCQSARVRWQQGIGSYIDERQQSLVEHPITPDHLQPQGQRTCFATDGDAGVRRG